MNKACSRVIVILFPVIIFTSLQAQYKKQANLNGDLGNAGSFGSAIVNSLEKSRLYFFAQEHNNKANIIIEHELLMALNKKYKLRIDLLEYAHSAAFLINQYLQTGQDSILSFIDPEANFQFIRSIKSHNDSIGDDRKIIFYGVDFENRYQGKYTRRAIEIILQKSNVVEKGPLYLMLAKIVASPPRDLHTQLEKLRHYLLQNEQESRQQLGAYFIDVLLIANAQFDFTPSRDDAMVNNFSRLYKELEKKGEPLMFYACFGTGHVNPDNRNGIAMKLSNLDSSPVKDDVSIVGIQYINCRFNKEASVLTTKGSLDFLCKNAALQQLPSLRTAMEPITFFSKKDLTGLNCQQAIKHFAGLIMVRDFDATTHWTWE